MRHRLLTGLWLLATLGSAAALPPRFEPVAAGMVPREVVPALAQDRAGFVWVATGDGLTRFDGLRLQPQELDGAPPAERNLGWVRALLAGRDGSVWIGTETQGLARFDPKDEKIRLTKPHGAGQPPEPPVRALAQGLDGAVWFASVGGGLGRFDPALGQTQRWRRGSALGTLPDDRLPALAMDADGVLWLGSWSGLLRYRPGDPDRGFERIWPRTEPAADATAPQVQALLVTGDWIWAGTAEGDLLRVQRRSGELQRLARTDGAVTAIAQASRQQVWVGTTRGIEVFDAASGELLQQLRHDPARPDSLAGDEITGLMRDAAGAVWVAGLGLGLQRYDPQQQALRVRGPDLDPASPLHSANVRALAALRSGGYLAATNAGPVAELDAALNTTGRLPVLPGRADVLLEAADGHLWAGAAERLYEFSAQRRLLRSLPQPGGAARRLLQTRDGTLWVATEDGLYRLAPGAGALARVPVQGPAALPLRGEVHALAQAPDGALWVGSSVGLLRVPPGGTVAQAVATDGPAGLGNPIVLGLLFDREGRLWLDTAVTGLHRMTAFSLGAPARASFDRVSERHGVIGKPFGVNLLADGEGRIWSQMSVYDPRTDRLDSLTAADGLRIGMPWFFSFAQGRDGHFVFGGSRGLLWVDPAAYRPSSYAPPLRLSELIVDGKRVAAAPAEQGLTLPAGTQRLSLEPAALDFGEPERLRYRYRMEGLDSAWTEVGAAQRQISYSHLGPGEYRLRVRATNRSGDWSAQELVLPLRVQPAWWQTAAAGVAALLAGGLLFWAGLRWRTRHLLVLQRTLEARVRERTLALEEASLTDPLTGLRNRRYLAERIEADCATVLRRHQAAHGSAPRDADLIFMLVDLDHFKRLNDERGHAVGDAALRQMRERLQGLFRQGDHLVRWGGEEFLVVARETGREHAAELAERLRAVVADTPFTAPDGSRVEVRCSVGFACYPLMPTRPEAFDWQALVAAADAALFAAKRAGRDGWFGLLGMADGEAAPARAALAQPAEHWAELPGWRVVASRPGCATSGLPGATAASRAELAAGAAAAG